LKAPTIPSARRKWVFRPKVGTAIQARPGEDRGTLQERNPVARHPSFPQPGRADRNRTEFNHPGPKNPEPSGRKARTTPAFTPILAKRKEEPESSNSTGPRKGARKAGCSRRGFSRLDRPSSGLLPASAVEEPTTCAEATEAPRSRTKPGQARKKRPPRRTVPNRLTAPTACRGPRLEKTHSPSLAPPKRFQGPSGNPGTQSDHHPCGNGTTSEHPVPP
jgi:hypothetical protein